MIRFCTNETEFDAALAACVAGDIIRLDHTKTFIGTFKLRNRGVIPTNNPIIIESDTDPTTLPAIGYRINPTYSPLIAKIKGRQQANAQNEPTLYTETATNGYLIRFLDIAGPMFGGGEVISLGYSDNTQTEYAQIPYNFTFDRCVIHGDRIWGQKRGIGINCNSFKLWNCYLYDFKGVGQDAQAVAGVNGEGPYEILNNYLQGAGYPFIIGGFDPTIKTIATVLASPAPTTNSCTVSTIKDLKIGQTIAILYTDGIGRLRRKHPFVTAINTSTNRITYDDIGLLPDIPGDIKWGVQPANLTFRRNHCHKPIEWATQPILGNGTTISAPTISPATPGLTAGTYYYKVQAFLLNGGYQGQTYWSGVSNEVSAILSVVSTVTLNWTAVPDATNYRIFRYQKDASNNPIGMVYYETANLTFTDSNTPGTSTTGTKIPTIWVTKNQLELKTMVGFQVDSNIIENSHQGSDVGMASWWKSNNQDGNQPFARLENGVVEKMLYRHVAGWASMSGQRTSGEIPANLPKAPVNITFKNILCFDSGPQYSWTETYGHSASGSPKNITFDHVTQLHTGNGACIVVSHPVEGLMDTVKWTNGLYIKGNFGFKGDAVGEGINGIPPHVSNYTFNKNVISNGNPATYTFPGSTNYTPDKATFEAQFKNYANGISGDYRLKRISEGDSINSLYINLGTDGKDLGADVNLINTAVAGVIEGLPEGAPVPPPPDQPPPPPPPPPDQPSSNVKAGTKWTYSPLVVGEIDIDFGFKPAAVLFYYNHATADGEYPDAGLGIGCSSQDGSMWAGMTRSKDNVASSLNTIASKTDKCITIVGNDFTIKAEAVVSRYNLTGITLNWTTVDPANQYVINAFAVGGTGVIGKAFNFQPPALTGIQDYNIGMQPDALFFYSPVNNNSALPFVGTKTISSFIGIAGSPTEQAFVVERNRGDQPSALAWRQHKTGSCLAVLFSAGIVTEAKLDSYLSTGFRLNYLSLSGEPNTFFGLALKGPRNKLGTIIEPIANGTVSYVVGFKPEGVIILSDFNATPGSWTTNARLGIGSGSSPTARAQVLSAAKHGVTPMVEKSRLDRTQIIRGIVEGNPSTNLSFADLTAISSNGFDLNWAGNPSGLEYIYFALGSAPTGPAAQFEGDLVQTYIPDYALLTDIEFASDLLQKYDLSASLSNTTSIFHSIVSFYGLRIDLDVKREIDSGEVNAVASDSGGTQVNFNKSFKDIDSITLTVAGVLPGTAIYDFADVPNPTGFKVLVFDNTGARVSRSVSWKARGIV